MNLHKRNFSGEFKLKKTNILWRNILRKGETHPFFMILSVYVHLIMFYSQPPKIHLCPCAFLQRKSISVRIFSEVCECEKRVLSWIFETQHFHSDKSKDHFLPSLFITKCNFIFLHFYNNRFPEE